MLKGKTVIELTDVNTGEVEKYEDENMFTSALDEVFNKAPFYFNNALLDKFHTIDAEETKLTPIYNHALGGILLFPETIEEDTERIYAPHDNNPIGIGSMTAVEAGTDTRIGTLSPFSEKSADGKSFTYIWDFGTSQCNGTIKTVCLTSDRGGQHYLEGPTVFQHEKKASGAGYNFMGIYRTSADALVPTDSETSPTGYVVGADNSGVYVFRTGNNSIMRTNSKKEDLTLFDDEYNETLFTFEEIGETSPAYIGYADGYIYYTKIDSSSNNYANAATIYKVDVDTKVRELFAVYSWNGGTSRLRSNYGKYRTCAVIDDTVYLPFHETDASVIPQNSIVAFGKNSDYSFGYGGEEVRKISGFAGFITSDMFMYDPINQIMHDFGGRIYGTPMGLLGCWAIMADAVTIQAVSYAARIYATIFTPYLATINNLKTPIEKTPTKTMKVTYTVTNY